MDVKWGSVQKIRCHLCGEEDVNGWEAAQGVGWRSADCPRCGKYEITSDAWQFRFSEGPIPPRLSEKQRAALAAWVKDESVETVGYVHLDIATINRVLNIKPPEPKINRT